MATRGESPLVTGTAADFVPPRPSLRSLREAAILRAPASDAREEARRAFIADLKKVARFLGQGEREVRRGASRAD